MFSGHLTNVCCFLVTNILRLARLGRASETNMHILRFSVCIAINPIIWLISQFLKIEPFFLKLYQPRIKSSSTC